MISGIIGIKIDQGQAFDVSGVRIPVTRIDVSGCRVVRVKTAAKDGYDAVVLGVGSKRAQTLTKPELALFKKSGLDKNPPRFLQEVSVSAEDISTLTSGNTLKVEEIFTPNDTVAVTGISKGKGFAGGVKRHHFKGGPRTHGQSDRERAPGSIGQTTTPGRVYKGKRMAGRMGNDRVTVKNLKVVSIDYKSGILTIKGVVPGGRNSLLIIRKQVN